LQNCLCAAQRQIYKDIRGFSRKREDIREKKAKSGVLQEPRKIKANKRVFLALILRWLV